MNLESTDPDSLNKLDLNDPEIAKSILFYDKHTLLEGKISENLFDQILFEMEKEFPNEVSSLNCEVVIARDHNRNKWLSFIWIRKESKNIKDLIFKLSQISTCITILFDEENKEFICIDPSSENRVLLSKYLKSNFKEIKTINPIKSVRDLDRQQQAFWGFMKGTYGIHLGELVVRPRIFINFFIQRYFKSVWDLDRIYANKGSLWAMEIKHKFPFGYNKLLFGLNDGEVELYRKLSSIGINCLHTIFVKPVWDKSLGSMYLLNSLQAKNKCAIISKHLTEEYLLKLTGEISNTAPTHTSIDGRSKLKFKKLPATDFKYAGKLENKPEFTAQKIFEILEGNGVDLQEHWLKKLNQEYMSIVKSNTQYP